MKVALYFATVLILIVNSVVCEQSDCENEVPVHIAKGCPVNSSNTELANHLLDYRDKEITRDGFKIFYDDYCMRTNIYTNCILENGLNLVPDECKSSEKFKSLIHSTDYAKLFADYYCANDGKRQMDAIDDDGVECLFSDIYMDCLYDVLVENSFLTKKSTCEFLAGTISCEQHLANCTNQKVGKYRVELFRNIQNEFNC